MIAIIEFDPPNLLFRTMKIRTFNKMNVKS